MRQPESNARATAFVPANCEEEAVALLSVIRSRQPDYLIDERESRFDAEQDALVLKNTEHYYRTILRGDAASWNIRDRHMSEALERLLEFHGPQARGIVWAHNTHVGDARCTDMAVDGMMNVGQLVRQDRGENDVVLVGFATHRGTVIAGANWDAPVAQMRVSPVIVGSNEDLLHRAAPDEGLADFDGVRDLDGLLDTRGQRAIGVVYNPAWERRGNDVPTVLPRR